MKIYVSHSRSFYFVKELYEPLKKSALAGNHQFIFPHDTSQEGYPSKDLFMDKGCDLVLAEVSFPSLGQGIELGWADIESVKIVCAYKDGAKISDSLKMVSKDFFTYKDSDDLIAKLTQYLNS
jgi:hypothetical protein